MAAAALEAAKIPHVPLDVPAGPAAPQKALTDLLRYDITIYCMSAFDTATLYVSHGPGFFAGQYRIGYWPWELPRFPDLWTDALTLVDEIWTGSTFTQQAYQSGNDMTVHKLPCPVVLPPVKPAPRSRLGLHDRNAFVFVYPFDVNSYLARKNPLGLVRAFRRAFPPGDNGVALLLRVNGDPNGHRGWPEIAACSAADNRITILAGTLARDRALGIVAACDCLVSPHRGEGFGRNIAEAILLGLPVLATAFSGCMDFLADEEGIRFALKPVGPGDYPFGEGQMWAEPSVGDMAKRMRAVVRAWQSDGAADEQRLLRRRSEVVAAYSPAKTGRDFARRLRQIERKLWTGRAGGMGKTARS
jgi:glycosyltransferase involved in cell wall biosynthesis